MQMTKIIVHIKNYANAVGVDKVLSYPYPKHNIDYDTNQNYLAVVDTYAKQNVLICPLSELRYVEVVDEEEELKDAFMD